MNHWFFQSAEQQLSKRGGNQGSVPGAAESLSRTQRDAINPGQPAWAKGLQRLYDEVVDEALPDELAKLLDKLDRAADDK